ncbi:MAG: hypothetical protein J4F43_02525 [Dehalococcoidia bacterium]|nr:hypothetical protein [Dehalococcoidia bacterium]
MTRNLLPILMGVVAVAALLVLLPILVLQPWNDPEEPGAPEDAGAPTAVDTEASQPEVTPILATTDVGLGSNRISFLLEGPTGFVTAPQVSVTSRYLPEDGSAPVAGGSASARHFVWPYGVRASYATSLEFDRPGRWDLEVTLPDGENGRAARVPLLVRQDTHTPSLGSPPPRGDNKTLRDVSLEELTTWSTPDPQLYTSTIDQAVANADPTMIVFSSPGTCTSPTCGPQAETVSIVKDKYRDDANFIHVEVYDNPAAIQGDLDNARYSPIVEEWGITQAEGYLNESWVFILDRDGLISSKYEGFASAEELEMGLLAVLN